MALRPSNPPSRTSAKTPALTEVISNTSPLQYLYQTDLIDLLPSLFGAVTVPDAVLEELAEGRRIGVPLPDIDALPWIRVQQVDNKRLLSIATDLGPGEREVLALGLQTPGSLVLLDDMLARRHARRLGIKMTGTLGILLRAKRSGLLDAVAPAVRQLDTVGFRIDPATHAAVIRLAGEPP